ncbi:MAG: DNA cytosine methyltransferase [Deltaproteobacteria bacterium]|jgi:DNA (cytosine-5)-methyltransferase 1|nr:DNA cytosine methyltransferase [Deltaproteobacteria bacterium]
MARECLRSIDLFSGAGGLSEGLAGAGFQVLFSNEIDPEYALTYRSNHPGVRMSTADIRTVDARKVMDDLKLKSGELDLMAGGPPCQGYSINAPSRSLADGRNHLFREFLRFAEVFSPRAILIENVPGLVSFENGRTLKDMLDSLSGLGYGAGVRILGAPYYGIPQMRWRTVIIGLRGKDVPPSAFPVPEFRAPVRANFTATLNGIGLIMEPGPGSSSDFVTVRHAIGDLPPLRNGERGAPVKGYASGPSCAYQERAREGAEGVLNHEAPMLSEINLKRLRYVKPGGNWTDIPDSLLPRGMQLARKSDHTKRYGRVEPDGLASTILTKCDPHWGAYFHYDQDRSFTVREAARLQSFPDNFVFYGTRVQQFAQVGNAIPPLMATSIGIAMKSVLS